MHKQVPKVPIHNIKTKEIHSLGFNVIDLKGSGGSEYDSSVPHRHNFYELLFFVNGYGKHEIDFTVFPLENNAVHFVSPGQIHKLTAKPKTKGFVLCFTEDFILSDGKENFNQKFPFYDEGFANPIMKLNHSLSSEIYHLAKSIYYEFKLNPDFSSDVLRSYLNIILVKLRQSFFNQQNTVKHIGSDKKEKMLLFKKLINTFYLQHKPVSFYSDKISVSPNHLNALCKKHEGKTAIHLIQERSLLEAKRLLHATEMSVKEISFHLNFEDVSYFNRFFKKLQHLTPIQYREGIAKNR